MLESDGRSLGVSQIAAAVDGILILFIAVARRRLSASFDYSESVAAARPLYGRSTGLGANRGIDVGAVTADHALRLPPAPGAYLEALIRLRSVSARVPGRQKLDHRA